MRRNQPNVQLPYMTYQPRFAHDERRIGDFLSNFTSNEVKEDPVYKKKKYMIELQNVANKDSHKIEIYLEDLEAFFTADQSKPQDEALLKAIKTNTKRYVEIFCKQVDENMPRENKAIRPSQFDRSYDIVMHQRLQNLKNQIQGGNNVGNKGNENNDNADNLNTSKKEEIPKELLRDYELIIIPGKGHKEEITPLRELKAEDIGGLKTIQGIVTKCTDVMPFLKVGVYTCSVCGNENYQTNYGRVFMPLVECQSQKCRTNRSRGEITLTNRSSKFISFQEITIQELNSEVPNGHVPRSIKAYCFGTCTRQCGPGDYVKISGVYLPSEPEDYRLRGRLVHDTYMEVFSIKRVKETYSDPKFDEQILKEINEEVAKCKKNKEGSLHFYEMLAKSLAPEIYGMDEIKKALLLLLVGGVDKKTKDGMKIRGNLNILLMGDPGIAKSQLLKYITRLSPRGVYTSGKGSSGVGLTAAVVKDQLTNDLVLEGGALVLADMGLCCIDEFDKMSDYDRANIHEVMEQQSISIAKAGITTTLNARTSILAAANPLYGRYNRNKTPHENINLPAALLSRFDLLFLLLDEIDQKRDLDLAKHIAYVHQYQRSELEDKKEGDNFIFSEKFLKQMIAKTKKIKPIIPLHLHNFIVEKYVERRKEENDKEKGNNKEGYQYITPRSLLAIIRLSQSLAKLKLADEVSQEDIDEALRLVEVSQSSINNKENEGMKFMEGKSKKPDTQSLIFNVIVESCKKASNNTARIPDILKEIKRKGINPNLLNSVLDDYVNLNIIYVNDKKTEVTLL